MSLSADQKKERRRNYYLRDKDKVREQSLVWRAANHERVKAKRIEWYRRNKYEFRQRQNEERKSRKAWAIAYLGGKCMRCSQVVHPAAFDFHHRDPALKDDGIGRLSLNKLSALKAELDKCDLLCANCHRVVHQEWRDSGVSED